MIKKLYDKCIAWAGYKYAKQILAFEAFIESSFFPIPPDVMIIPMVISKKADFTTKLSTNLEVPEAGKLMGLASYGRTQEKWNAWFKNTKNSFKTEINAYDIFLEVEALIKQYDKGNGKAYLRDYIVDLAYKVQQELEKVMLHLIQTAVRKTGIKNVCIAGGVGLNSVANYKILKALCLDDIFICSVASSYQPNPFHVSSRRYIYIFYVEGIL